MLYLGCGKRYIGREPSVWELGMLNSITFILSETCFKPADNVFQTCFEQVANKSDTCRRLVGDMSLTHFCSIFADKY